MTVNLNLPALNADLLTDLVTWAYADVCKEKNLLSKFPGWGGWDQSHWSKEIRNGVCQTAFCIAGQAVVQSGYGIIYDDPEDMGNGRTLLTADMCQPVKAAGVDEKGATLYEAYGAASFIDDAAQRTLGLTEVESYLLFDGDNSIASVISVAKVLARIRGLDLNLDPEVDAAGNLSVEEIAHKVYQDWMDDYSDSYVEKRQYRDALLDLVQTSA